MPAIEKLIKSGNGMNEKIHPKYDYTVAEVVWAVREEMALTLDDVLGRRARLLFIDARAAIEAAPKVAQVMSKELGKDQAWIDSQTESFIKLANNYIVK